MLLREQAFPPLPEALYSDLDPVAVGSRLPESVLKRHPHGGRGISESGAVDGLVVVDRAVRGAVKEVRVILRREVRSRPPVYVQLQPAAWRGHGIKEWRTSKTRNYEQYNLQKDPQVVTEQIVFSDSLKISSTPEDSRSIILFSSRQKGRAMMGGEAVCNPGGGSPEDRSRRVCSFYLAAATP